MAISTEQREARRLGLGGSDIAAILGLDQYNAPIDIYNDKVFELPPEASNEAANRGNLLEPIIIGKYEEETGQKVKLIEDTILHNKYPFLRANIDGISDNMIIEAKSVHKYAKIAKEFGDFGTDRIPNKYIVQCAFYIEVMRDYNHTDIPVAFVKDNTATLDSIERFGIYKYQRNESLGQKIIDNAIFFWEEHVLKKIPPPGESKRPKVSSLTRGKLGTPEIVSICAEMAAQRRQIDIVQQALEENRVKVMEFIEDFDCLEDEGGGVIATCRTQYANRLDVKKFETEHPDLYKQYLKSSSSRIFRLKD